MPAALNKEFLSNHSLKFFNHEALFLPDTCLPPIYYKHQIRTASLFMLLMHENQQDGTTPTSGLTLALWKEEEYSGVGSESNALVDEGLNCLKIVCWEDDGGEKRNFSI